MIDPDNPDQLLDLLIDEIGTADPKSKIHFKTCKQCRSVLSACLIQALRNMVKDPILITGFELASKHVESN